MGFLRWFKNSVKIKRWLFLIFVGIVLLCYGIANILVHDTMQIKELAVKVGVSFAIGLTIILFSLFKMQKRMLEIMVEESDTRTEKNNINNLIFNKKVYNQGPKIVVIGGGAGLNTVLRGLKNYTDNITALVTVSDYGEEPTDSRAALEVLPMEDIKESFEALAYNEEEMKKILDYRFTDKRLKGLDFSDIYFLAMNSVYPNFTESVEKGRGVFNMTGTVLPVTLDPVTICAELEDGTVVEQRSRINEIVTEKDTKISRIYVTPTNTLTAPGVLEAIREADAIIIGPGSLYTSVIPNLLIKGIAHEIRESKAMKVYVSNIMTEQGETDDYKLSDHLKAIQEYVGKGIIDYCIFDTGEVVPEFIKQYNLKGADIVVPDKGASKALGVKLIQRNLSMVGPDGEHIIHDPDVIASTIIQLVCDELEFNDMENDSQFMSLNNILRETKKEKRREARKDRKFQKSGRKKFEPKENYTSKFETKYKNRISSLKNEGEEVNEKEKEVVSINEKINDEIEKQIDEFNNKK